MIREVSGVPMLLRLFRRWWWVVVISCLVSGTAGYGLTKHIKPTYEATVELYVNTAALTSSSSPNMDVHVAINQAAALADMATSYSVAEQAVRTSHLGITADALLGEITAVAGTVDPIISLTVADQQQSRVAPLANVLATTIISINRQYQNDRYADMGNALRSQIASTSNDIASYTAQIRALTDASGSSLGVTTQLTNLSQQIGAMQSNVATLKAKLSDVLLSQVQSATTVTVIAQAQTPAAPTKPNLQQNLLLGVIVGLLLAGGIIGILVQFGDPLASPDEVERFLYLPVLALIPRVAAMDKLDTLAEALRLLHLTVSSSRGTQPMRRLLVASGSKGEGKSTIASSYAVAAAQAGKRVVLVDGDMASPSFHDLFLLDPSPGLADVLRGMPFTPAILHKCRVNNLRVVCSSWMAIDPFALLASDRMGMFLDMLSADADLVVMDCPPILQAGETSALARHVDGVLLVLDQETTTMHSAAQTVRQLRLAGAPIIGAVINRLHTYVAEQGPSGERAGGATGGEESPAPVASDRGTPHEARWRI
jgi:capsular exopolysaccharide synthesis family protein